MAQPMTADQEELDEAVDSDEDAPKSWTAWKKQMQEDSYVDDLDEFHEDLKILTKNMQRCDVRIAAQTSRLQEGSGNPRWQCQRAAQVAREKGRLSLANFLDEWADKHKKAQCVCHEKI